MPVPHSWVSLVDDEGPNFVLSKEDMWHSDGDMQMLLLKSFWIILMSFLKEVVIKNAG